MTQTGDEPKWPISVTLAFFGLWLGAGWDILSRAFGWPYGLVGAVVSVACGLLCLALLAFHPQARRRVRAIWQGGSDDR